MMTITAVDDVWIRVDCNDGIAQEISDHFSFDVPGARYMPQYRSRNWAGKIRLFKLRGHLLYRGLLPRLLEFAAQREYSVENLVPTPNPLRPDLLAWVHAQPLPVTPRDYQVSALRSLLDRHRGIVLSPTGSGKSLIIHLLVQALQVPTLIVVPTTGLVSQMIDDFTKYGADPASMQAIRGGLSKDQHAPVVISTWQSIYQLPPSYFAAFSCVIVDEVHLAKAKSLTGLLEKCRTIPYRFGCTGTLDDTQAHRLILEGLFGSVTRVTTTQELVKNQQLTPLRVKMCVLEYPPAVRKDMRGALYPDEVEYIIASDARLNFVAKLVIATSRNTLVLFNFVEKHGIPLYDRIRQHAPHRDVHFISGATDPNERERIRAYVSERDGQILVASYGTFSTGVNIPNLNTVVFASPSKSKIRVLQSIGRTLRLHEDKTYATLIDIVDDLRIGSHVNHVYRHAEQRVQYYSVERFPYTVHTYPLL